MKDPLLVLPVTHTTLCCMCVAGVASKKHRVHGTSALRTVRIGYAFNVAKVLAGRHPPQHHSIHVINYVIT